MPDSCVCQWLLPHHHRKSHNGAGLHSPALKEQGQGPQLHSDFQTSLDHMWANFKKKKSLGTWPNVINPRVEPEEWPCVWSQSKLQNEAVSKRNKKFGISSWWPTSIVLTTQRAKAGGSLQPVNSRPSWQHKENLLGGRSVASGVGTAGKWWNPKIATFSDNQGH